MGFMNNEVKNLYFVISLYLRKQAEILVNLFLKTFKMPLPEKILSKNSLTSNLIGKKLFIYLFNSNQIIV